jgi:acetoin utilization protein AcuB
MRTAEHMRGVPGRLAPETSLEEAGRMMGQLRVPALVVTQRHRVVGVVSEKDLAAAWPSPTTIFARRDLRRWLAHLRVEDVMHRDPAVVAPATPFVDAVRLLRESRTGLLPVVDDGRLVGVVTVFDALAGLSGRREAR